MGNSKTKVAIAKGNKNPSEAEIEALVRASLAHLGDLSDLIGPGKRVLIKPNVADTFCIRGDVTDLRVVRGLAKIVKEKGAEVIIAESGSVGQDTEKIYEICGYDTLRQEGYELVDMHLTEEIKVPVSQPSEKIKELKVYKILQEVDTIISVPVLKTHQSLLVTLSLKNMKGGIPDKEKRKFHLVYGVEEAIAQLNTLIRPHLCVVDGIYAGAGGMAPIRVLEEMDLIVAGRDPVAVDATCSRIMGIDPDQVIHIKLAEGLGVGTTDSERIEILGQSIQAVARKFALPAERKQALDEDLDLDVIMDEKTCTGCQTMVFATVNDIVQAGQKDALKGLTIVTGKDLNNVPDVPKEKLILIGNCTAKFKDRGRHVEGCPIWPNEMMYEITGVQMSETFMGDFVDQSYEFYKKKLAQGARPGFPWDKAPDERELRRYIE